MSAKIIDGKHVSGYIRTKLKEYIEILKKDNITPGLGVILVGEDPASSFYVNSKEKACAEIGIYSDDRRLPSSTSEAELLSIINEMNNDPKISGILVQLPLPQHIDEDKILLAIDPAKDVDGFHPDNVGKLVLNQQTFLPCTPHGVLQLLKYYDIEPQGKHVVIIGRSNIVGKPLANLFIQKSKTGNATVTVCHSRTKNMAEICSSADILVAAVGMPELVTDTMIKDGAVIVDVGINRVEDSSKKRGYRICGDVNFAQAEQKASWITPVPGGVGPMTITMLLYNTVFSAAVKNNRFDEMEASLGF
jgi:methylenetetrahydrofolate dehydrogenase (NADP+) / methenyltetrahydrofolate cyclohydrolase